MATMDEFSQARIPRKPRAPQSTEIDPKTYHSCRIPRNTRRMTPDSALTPHLREQKDVPNRNSAPNQSVMFLSRLSADALQELNSIERQSTIEPGSRLFSEGDTPKCVHLVLEGMVKLSINSSSGRKLILRIAKPGDVIGMTSVILSQPYDMTAEPIHTCKIASIPRADFLRLLRNRPETAQAATIEIGQRYIEACETLRLLNLNLRAAGRIAHLLLNWSSAGVETEHGTRITLFLTHEEIGEFAGVSRETVTRIFAEFREKRLILLNGSTITIPSKLALLSITEASRAHRAS